MEECFARVLGHLWHFHNTRLKPPSTATYWTDVNCFPTFHKYFTGNCFDFFLKLSFSIEWCVLTLFRVFPIKSYFRTRPVYTTQPFQSYLREIFIIVTPADEKCLTFVRNILWCFLLLFNLRRKLPRVLLWKSSSSLDSKPITWKQSQQAISAANVEFFSWDETQCRVLVDSNPDAMTIHCTMCTLFHTNSAGLSKLGHILKNPKKYFYEHIFFPALTTRRKMGSFKFLWFSNSKIEIFSQKQLSIKYMSDPIAQ